MKKALNKELLHNIRIVYVEDETLIQEEVSYFLKKHIPNFYTANNGEEGLQRIQEVHPDLIITDIQMPKMNGLEMLKHMDKKIPVIITTAYSDLEFFIQAIELKIDKFAIKPINLADLIYDIQEVIIKNRLQHRLYEKQNLLDIINENVLISITNKEGVIIDASEAFCKFIKYDKKELLGKTHAILRHEETPNSFYERMWETIMKKDIFKSEIRNKKRDGEVYWANLTITPVLNQNNEIENFTAIRQDVTSNKKLKQLTIEDELTKLYNRRYFNTIIEKEIGRVKREKSILSIAFFDVDYFKNYNDTYGHQEGDKVLIDVANIFKNATLRGSDYAFRIGGEEFCIIFSGNSKDESMQYVKSIIQEVEALKIVHEGSQCSTYLTLSAGLVVVSHEKMLDAKMMYKYADDALYEAKTQGKNRVYLLEE